MFIGVRPYARYNREVVNDLIKVLFQRNGVKFICMSQVYGSICMVVKCTFSCYMSNLSVYQYGYLCVEYSSSE